MICLMWKLLYLYNRTFLAALELCNIYIYIYHTERKTIETSQLRSVCLLDDVSRSREIWSMLIVSWGLASSTELNGKTNGSERRRGQREILLKFFDSAGVEFRQTRTVLRDRPACLIVPIPKLDLLPVLVCALRRDRETRATSSIRIRAWIGKRSPWTDNKRSYHWAFFVVFMWLLLFSSFANS